MCISLTRNKKRPGYGRFQFQFTIRASSRILVSAFAFHHGGESTEQDFNVQRQ